MFEYIFTAFKSLLWNKLRFSLSILWIIVWITSVTVMLWMWEWVKKQMMDNFSSMTNVIIINPSSWDHFWWMWDENQRETPFVKRNDIFNNTTIEKLESTITNIKSVVSKSYVSVYPMTYAWKEIYGSVYWVSDNYFLSNELESEIWFIFNKKDNQDWALLAVVWNSFVSRLLQNSKVNPIWMKIDMWWKPVVIAWILKEKKGDWEANNSIFIPINTSIERFWVDKLESLSIFVNDINFIEETKRDVWFYLTKLSGVENPRDAWFTIQNDKWWIDQIKKSMLQFQLFLWWISWISLFVWGIWIMNIMLVSVTERTREIWIRKALWAKRKNILFQFLTESIIISIVWCILAFMLSISIAYFLNMYLEQINIYLSPFIFIFSSIISIIIWVVFWIIPAWKASKLNPITALRFE